MRAYTHWVQTSLSIYIFILHRNYIFFGFTPFIHWQMIISIGTEIDVIFSYIFHWIHHVRIDACKFRFIFQFFFFWKISVMMATNTYKNFTKRTKKKTFFLSHLKRKFSDFDFSKWKLKLFFIKFKSQRFVRTENRMNFVCNKIRTEINRKS